MKVIRTARKHALSRGHLGCVGEIRTLNVARGCAGGCAFCYARCVTGAPEGDSLLVYSDLPSLLRHELDTTHRKSPLPPYVVFSTYTDGFLGGSEVLEVSRACLEIILNRRVGVSLSTRGAIPDDALAVLGRHPSHVQVTVPLVSLSEEYTRAWEPGTALPRDRLFLVQRLLQLGIVPRLRVEPLIPFVNDHTEMLRELVSALVGLGLTEATLGFLHLRPGVGDQMRKEAPVDLQRLVLGCFPTLSESPDRKFHHLPEKQRLAGLRRIQRIGREHGLRVSACHCQNPGLPASRCPVAPPELPRQRGNQQELDLPLAEEQAPADREIPDEKE